MDDGDGLDLSRLLEERRIFTRLSSIGLPRSPDFGDDEPLFLLEFFMFEKSFDQNPIANHPPRLTCSCGPRQVMSNRTQTRARKTNQEKLKQVFQNQMADMISDNPQRSCTCISHFRSTHQQCKTHRWPSRPLQKRAFLLQDKGTTVTTNTLIQPLSIEVLCCHTNIPPNRIQIQIQPLSSHKGGETSHM